MVLQVSIMENAKPCHESQAVKSNPALPMGKKTGSVQMRSFYLKFNKIQYFKNNSKRMNT